MHMKQISKLSLLVACGLIFCMVGGEGHAQISPAPIIGLTVISPNGGETISMDDSLTIRWDMGDSVNALMSQLVFNISLDSGKTFLYLGDIRKSSPRWAAKQIKYSLHDSVWDEQLLEWRAITPSNGCLLFISQYNSQTIDDLSDNLFRITAPARSNNFSPAIRGTIRSVQGDAVYTIQGRRMRTASMAMQKSAGMESKGAYIENGLLRLIAH